MTPTFYSLLILTLGILLPSKPSATRIAGSYKPESGRFSRGIPPWAILAAVFIAVFLFMVIGRITVVIAALIIVITIAHHVSSARQRSSQLHAEDAVAKLLGTMTADLRAGSSVPAALTRGADDLATSTSAPSVLKTAVATAAVLAHRGGSISTVLKKSHPQLKALGALCSLSERHGIPLSDVFDQAHNQIDSRKRHRSATAASLQGPQATAIVLALLPFAGIFMGTIMGANPAGFLLGGGLGGMLLVIGVGLVCAGFTWSRKLISNAAG
ncbi:type II secretion system F family protein [Corynebacterium sp. L4756]|uniref:type II secretion system F family protein n=1 Tax=unclassified Corynebacterium TaxID=2624378 RepID=UPI00374D2691